MKNLIFAFLAILIFSACSKDDDTSTNSNNNQNIPMEFAAFEGVFSGQGIGAAANIADDIILLFSSDGLSYAWYEDNEIKKTERIDKEDGLFDGLKLGAVGGAIDYEEERLIFFNKQGSIYQWSHIDPDAVVGSYDIDTLINFEQATFGLYEWGEDNSCPFDELGAIMGFSKFPEGCDEVGDDDDFLWMINDEGASLTMYNKENREFTEAVELEQWRSTNVCGGSPVVFPLQSIGAACIYEDDTQSLQLYFSNSGKQFTIFNPATGSYSDIFNI